MRMFVVDLLIGEFAFQVLVEIFESTHSHDNTERDEDDGETS
jgi:hypothetical protein